MKKVLVIDDDPDIVELLKERLQSRNYNVITASNGEEGLNKVKTQTPNAIIVDVAMPKMDGYTFVLELKAHEKLGSTPVIVLTAKENMKALFEIEGVVHYLVKPFVAEELLGKLNDILAE